MHVYVVATEIYTYDDDPTPQTRPDIPQGVSGTYLYRGDESLVFTTGNVPVFKGRIETATELDALAHSWGYPAEYLHYLAGW